MQISDQCFPVGTIYNYLFSPSRKRNRIEFIDDFPNEAEVISSLQIHPHGWSAVSRNINGDENDEVSLIFFVLIFTFIYINTQPSLAVHSTSFIVTVKDIFDMYEV